MYTFQFEGKVYRMPLEHVSTVEIEEDPYVGPPHIKIKFRFMDLEKEIEYEDEDEARDLKKILIQDLSELPDTASESSESVTEMLESVGNLVEAIQNGNLEKVDVGTLPKKEAEHVEDCGADPTDDEPEGGFPETHEGPNY